MMIKVDAWAPTAEVKTYDAMRQSANKRDFSPWTITDGFPAADVLIDDSYELGGQNFEGATALKVRHLLAAGIQAVAVKFYLTSNACRHMNVSASGIRLPYGMEEIASAYEHVRLLAPGRAHSPEVYFCGVGFHGQGYKMENVAMIARALYYKAALMTVANDFRSVCFNYGLRSAFSSEWPIKTNPGFWKEICSNLGFGAYRPVQIFTLSELITTGAGAVIPSGLEMDVIADLFNLPPELSLESIEEARAVGQTKGALMHERTTALLAGMDIGDSMVDEEEEEGTRERRPKRRAPDDREKLA